MASIARPKTKTELVEALLTVRRDLEATGVIGKNDVSESVVVPAPKAESVAAANDNSQQTQESVPPANDNLQKPAGEAASVASEQPARPVPLRRVSAEQISSATDDTQGGLRRDLYREQIAEPEAEQQVPPPIPSAAVSESAAGPLEVDSALMRPEVTDGLTELLSKWDIFEKSGIFGLGPSGAQHPTYEKIAPLPMQEVLAGNWDGADAAVAKTINEYVAGWESEQSVSPQEGETFEVYLRRVIASYLDESARATEVAPAANDDVPPSEAVAA